MPSKILPSVGAPDKFTISGDEFRACEASPYNLTTKFFPIQVAAISDKAMLDTVNKLRELSKLEFGVTRIEWSQDVACATPWPNSTGFPVFKLILAASVVPIVATNASPADAKSATLNLLFGSIATVYFTKHPLGIAC